MPIYSRILLLIFLLVTPGCVARRTDGTINFHASMTSTVLTAESSYETLLRSLGDAHRDGTISRSTLERGRSIGNEAYKAISTAKVTLAAYLRSGGLSGSPQADVFTALATLATVIAQLERFYVKETDSVLPRSME
jgi:hypothetical protein